MIECELVLPFQWLGVGSHLYYVAAPPPPCVYIIIYYTDTPVELHVRLFYTL